MIKTHNINGKYFPELKSSGGGVKFELDLSNYATETDLKHVATVGMSKSAKKFSLLKIKCR